MGPVFPYGTLLINVSGSIVVGFFMIWATERVLVDPRWRLLRGGRLLRLLHNLLRLCLRDHGLLRTGTMAADVHQLLQQQFPLPGGSIGGMALARAL